MVVQRQLQLLVRPLSNRLTKLGLREVEQADERAVHAALRLQPVRAVKDSVHDQPPVPLHVSLQRMGEALQVAGHVGHVLVADPDDQVDQPLLDVERGLVLAGPLLTRHAGWPWLPRRGLRRVAEMQRFRFGGWSRGYSNTARARGTFVHICCGTSWAPPLSPAKRRPAARHATTWPRTRTPTRTRPERRRPARACRARWCRSCGAWSKGTSGRCSACSGAATLPGWRRAGRTATSWSATRRTACSARRQSKPRSSWQLRWPGTPSSSRTGA